MRFTTRLSAGAATGLIGLAVTAGPAVAHVSANPGEATAGKSTSQQFKIGHGCDGSPTIKVTFFIPDGVVGVKPEVEPGWTVETKVGAITPYDSHGETISEGVKELTFTAGTPLPDDQVTFFGLSMTMPDKAGETVHIPVVQICQQGELRWIEIPVESQAEPEHPAPGIELVAAEAGGDGHGRAPVATGEQAGGDVTGAEGEDASAVQSGTVDGSDNTLALIALVVGVAGLLTGGASLAMVRKRS